MEWQIIVVAAIYMGLIFLIGIISARKTFKTQGSFIEEYFLGNRSMNGFILAMTLTTTYISAGSFIAGQLRLLE